MVFFVVITAKSLFDGFVGQEMHGVRWTYRRCKILFIASIYHVEIPAPRKTLVIPRYIVLYPSVLLILLIASITPL